MSTTHAQGSRRRDIRIHKTALIAAVALAAIPAGALAAKPSPPTKGKSATAKVQFVLHGTLSAYTAANGATNGTISLTVKSSNHDSNTLKGMTLVFVVTSNTKVGLHDGTTIANGDNGTVKLRGTKNNSTWG